MKGRRGVVLVAVLLLLTLVATVAGATAFQARLSGAVARQRHYRAVAEGYAYAGFELALVLLRERVASGLGLPTSLQLPASPDHPFELAGYRRTAPDRAVVVVEARDREGRGYVRLEAGLALVGGELSVAWLR